MDNVTSSRNSTSNSSAPDFDRDETLAQVEITVLSVMFVVTVLGNVAVLLALSARPRKKLSRMYYFILHLSIADLCTAFLSILPQLVWDITYRFRGGAFLCKMVKYSQTLGPYLSAYILMATALDRYQAVCHPLAYCSWTSRRSRLMVWTAWFLALCFCLPQVVVFSYQEIGPGVYDCWATFIQPWGERTYVTWYCVSVFIIPFTVLAVTYSSICREIWLHAGRSPQQQGNCSPLISRAKMNTVKQMVAVLFLYVACSAPFICAQLWATWDDFAHTRPFFTGATFTILTLLYSLNSCMNPWIYMAFNRELLRFLGQQLLCKSHDTASYKSGSGGSGSSTGTGGGECPATCSKINQSSIVTKTSQVSLRSSNGCSSIPSPKDMNHKVSLSPSAVFVGKSSNCRLHSNSGEEAVWCGSRSAAGLVRPDALKRKTSFDSCRSPYNTGVAQHKSFTYSFLTKTEKASGHEGLEERTDSPRMDDEEPVVALLRVDDESRRLQVHF